MARRSSGAPGPRRRGGRGGLAGLRRNVARAEEIVVPVQVNGKVRGRLTVAAGTPDDKLERLALADPQVKKYLEGKTIKKVVVVNGKLVSIVTD